MTTKTTSRTRRSAVTLSAAALGTAILASALTGCAMIEPYMPEQQKHYDTYSDAPSGATSEDVAWFMPAWVPEDAQDIDVRLQTKVPGYVIAFDSEAGVDTGACDAVDGTKGGPAMTADFLPDHLPSTGLVTCGDGRLVAEIDGRWFGWTPEQPVASERNDTLRTDS